MQPSYSSIGEVFSVPKRYTVPLFQRPYVWSKDEQWQPLWDDIRALAERVLNPPAHKPVAGHFLGTVVLEQIKTAAVEMPRHQVIDGQQRLTTLQLLLKAVEHALRVTSANASEEDAHPIEIAAGQVSQLSRNQYTQQIEDAYKVWPTNDDRAAFKAVMDSEAEAPVEHGTRMAEAYSYFKTVVMEWLSQGQLGTRALAFTAAIKDHLRLIILDLDQTDEPQAIFETLNAHGTPLLPADLIKNWLLWQAGKQDLDSAQLYESHWSKFDRDQAYWRKPVGTGHAARPRVDTFLQNWLTVATGDLIPVKHLYDRFLAHANALASSSAGTLNVQNLMSEIAEYAGYYSQIDTPNGSSSFDGVLRRLNRLDFVVFRPVLMALLARAEGDTADAELGAKALESFLVRRMVGNLGTRSYGTLALDLVRTVKQVPVGEAASPALIAALSLPAGEWPDDQSFRQSWATGRFYGWFRRDRVAMLLQAIEEHYQTSGGKSEPLLPFDYAKLQIEHIMPQSWATNWPLNNGHSALERDTFVQNIGNLTLVSNKLNPSLSNSAWRVDGSTNCKSAQLAKHSGLRLNAMLLDEYGADWNEDTIQQRAASLFEQARQIWPSPSALS